jgi:hypothetical protein
LKEPSRALKWRPTPRDESQALFRSAIDQISHDGHDRFGLVTVVHVVVSKNAHPQSVNPMQPEALFEGEPAPAPSTASFRPVALSRQCCKHLCRKGDRDGGGDATIPQKL